MGRLTIWFLLGLTLIAVSNNGEYPSVPIYRERLYKAKKKGRELALSNILTVFHAAWAGIMQFYNKKPRKTEGRRPKKRNMY